MKYGLTNKQLDQIIKIIKNYPEVDEAILFGSRAIDTFKEASDVDIVIKGKKANYTLATRIKSHLEDETYLPFFFDIIAYNSIDNDALREHIQKYGKVLYSKNDNKNGWRECRLGDVIDVKHGYAFKGNNITTNKTNIILVTPGNFNIGGGFKNDKYKYFNANYPVDYVLKQGDVVVTMTDLSKDCDTLGYAAKIPYEINKKFLHNQRIGLIRFINNSVNKDFIYWIMRTREYHSYIVGASSGTSIYHTSPTNIKNYTFLLPSISEQNAIAEILSSLDDKIDLLHRQNKTLESLAETLFRQWFIEEASEEWGTFYLKDLIESANTGLDAIKRAPIVDEKTGIKCLRIQDISQNKSFQNWGNTKVKNSDFEKAKLCAGDIIMARTCSPGIIYYVRESLNAVFNNGLAKIKPNKKKTYSIFLYYLFKTEEFIGHIYSISGGTSVQLNMKLGDLLSYQLKFPTKKIQEEYYSIFSLIDDKISKNLNKAQILIQLRNMLLPKLMNGEVVIQ